MSHTCLTLLRHARKENGNFVEGIHPLHGVVDDCAKRFRMPVSARVNIVIRRDAARFSTERRKSGIRWHIVIEC